MKPLSQPKNEETTSNGRKSVKELIKQWEGSDAAANKEKITESTEVEEICNSFCTEAPLSRLFRPHMRLILRGVLRKLQTNDLVTLMLTNKDMFNECNSVRNYPHSYIYPCLTYSLYAHKAEMDPISKMRLGSLHYLPFRVIIQEFIWKTGVMSSESLKSIVAHLEHIKVAKINYLWIRDKVTDNCWEGLLEMMETFGVERFSADEQYILPIDVQERIFTMKTLKKFSCCLRLIQEEFVVLSTVSTLYLYTFSLNMDGCAIIIDRWLKDDLVINRWICKEGPTTEEMSSYFAHRGYALDSPNRAVHEPVVFLNETTFWICRHDRSNLTVGWEKNGRFAFRGYARSSSKCSLP